MTSAACASPSPRSPSERLERRGAVLSIASFFEADPALIAIHFAEQFLAEPGSATRLSVCALPEWGSGRPSREDRELFMQRMEDWAGGLGLDSQAFLVAARSFIRPDAGRPLAEALLFQSMGGGEFALWQAEALARGSKEPPAPSARPRCL